MNLEAKLAWHFEYNFYPPITPLIIPAAVLALEAVAAGEPERRIELVPGHEVAAFELIEDLRLEDVVSDD